MCVCVCVYIYNILCNIYIYIYMKTEIRAQLGESDDLSKCTVLSFLKTHEIKAMQKNIKLCGIIWNSRFLAFSWRSS